MSYFAGILHSYFICSPYELQNNSEVANERKTERLSEFAEFHISLI